MNVSTEFDVSMSFRTKGRNTGPPVTPSSRAKWRCAGRGRQSPRSFEARSRGEVPEDYVFDAIGAGGAATVIRMSELFRGGDTLMIITTCSRETQR